MKKFFTTALCLVVLIPSISFASVFGVATKSDIVNLQQQIITIAKQVIEIYNKVLGTGKLGAAITQTQLTDTIGTFRTNVNAGLVALNEQLTATTSSDPGHTHSVTSSLTGTIDTQLLFGKLGGAASSSINLAFSSTTNTLVINGIASSTQLRVNSSTFTSTSTFAGQAQFNVTTTFSGGVVGVPTSFNTLLGMSSTTVDCGDAVTTASTSIMSVSVPAGTLSSTKTTGVRGSVRMTQISNGGSIGSLLIAARYGGATFGNFITNVNDLAQSVSDGFDGKLEFELFSQGPNKAWGYLQFIPSSNASTTNGLGFYNANAIATTTSGVANIDITTKWSVSNAAHTCTMRSYSIDSILQ